jgi:chromosome segregation ATPase
VLYIKIKKYFVLLAITIYTLLATSIPSVAQNKKRTFVREYTYNASETDSKVSSRRKALDQVRTILLNEIGTYVEKWVKSDVTEKRDTVVSDFFKREIKSVTAGITETEIIKEEWNGYKYYVRAKITINTDDVISKINNTLEARLNNQKIDTLRALLRKEKRITENKNEEINKLKQKINKEQSRRRESEEEVDRLRSDLRKLKNKLKSLNKEKIKIRNKLQRIENKIRNLTISVTDKIRTGMTKREVVDLMGEPRGSDECANYYAYNYGRVWVLFRNNIVQHAVYNRHFEGSCKSISLYKDEYKNLLTK